MKKGSLYTIYEGRNKNIYIASFLLLSLWLISSIIVIPMPIIMVGIPTLLVYIGSVSSLSLIDHSVIPAAEKDQLSMKDVYQFPVFGNLKY